MNCIGTTRRLVALGAAATLALSLAACTGGTTDTGGEGSAEALTMTAGAATTWSRNFNIYAPTSTRSPAPTLLFESLVRVNYTDSGSVEPWLAESFEWNDEGTELTFHLRDDVTWSDGEAFDADDVVYTLQLMLDHPEFNVSGATFTGAEKVDAQTVKVSWDHVAYTELPLFGGPGTRLAIVPEHQWADQDLMKWTNPDPVGTGPYVLDRFQSQQITYRARDNYWGDPVAVPEIKIPAILDSAVQPKLLSGEIQHSTITWPNASEEFEARDPGVNQYSGFSTGGSEALFFNNAVAPYDDVHVRRAISFSIDAEQMLSLYDVGSKPASITGLSERVYGDLIVDEYRGLTTEQDADRARQELAESGYTVQDGALFKDNKKYPLELKVIQEYPNWNAWARGLADQIQKTLGLKVKVSPVPASNFVPQVNSGDYGMCLMFAGNGDGVHAAYSTMLHSKYAKPVGEDAIFNQTRFKDPAADKLLEELSATDDEGRIAEIAAQLQEIVVEQVPLRPLVDSTWFVIVNASKWQGWPQPEDAEYVPHWYVGPDFTMTLQNLQPAD